MLAWLSANIGTILAAAIVLAIIAAVMIKMKKEKKKGGSSCGGGCAGCPMAGECHSDSRCQNTKNAPEGSADE